MASHHPSPFALLLLAAALLLSTMASDDADGQEGRNKRHPKSRQRAQQSTECISGYKQRIDHHCRYPSTEQPCFAQPESSESAVEEAAKKCCQSGGGAICSMNHFEPLCCRTMDCLEKCYGTAFFQRFRDRGFKYLDILLRPHPHHHHRNGRDLEGLAKLMAAELDEKELGELEAALMAKIDKEKEEEGAD